MTDALPILAAHKRGYKIFSDNENYAWYMKGDRMIGPFDTLEQAAYDALADYDMNEAYKHWKGKDEDESR